MKKILVILLIPLSFFSRLHSEQCDCLELGYGQWATRQAYLSLDNCMFRLPKLHKLVFFELNHPLIIIENEAVDPKITLNFYFDQLYASYSIKGITSLFFNLRKDIDEELKCWERVNNKKISALRAKKIQGDEGERERKERDRQESIAYFLKEIDTGFEIKKMAEEELASAEETFLDRFLSLVERCRERHQNPRAFYEFGCWNFLKGDSLTAIQEGITFINLAEKEGKKEQLSSETYLQQGEAYADVLAYDQAIESLTKAIELNPNNKKAYFERAAAYFEKGNFDRALDDYLLSEAKSTPIKNTLSDHVNFSRGLSQGIIQGGTEAIGEFIPSILASFQGLGQGLWAFAQDPVQVSSEMVSAALRCIDFVKENSPQEVLSILVPELKELIENWEESDFQQKGTGTGHLIGKYGVEIFANMGIMKGVQAYRDLKKANNLLTFEAAALSKRNRELIRTEALQRAQARETALKNANLKIQWDKQGKHIEGHRNFQPVKNKSILTHPDPQALVNQFCGKGMKVGTEIPGTAGYQEIVNFGEFIGYEIDLTGKQTATTWGKIHYAKDGVHIVPTKSRG